VADSRLGQQQANLVAVAGLVEVVQAARNPLDRKLFSGEHSRHAPTSQKGHSLKSEFWHERWEEGQLGFHQTQVNAQLAEYWERLELPPDVEVFVPLCGKSLDMVWLRERGHPVIGVEISPIGIRDFFRALHATPRVESVGVLERSKGEGYTLYGGDLFDLSAEDLIGVRGCYDRGSLVALPEATRKRYAEHLIRILPEQISILLISLEYDESKMSAPPHSVSPDEIESLFGADFEIETLTSTGWGPAEARFRERGLDVWCETVLHLARGRCA
jgi:thiopurine S-methyltransferase